MNMCVGVYVRICEDILCRTVTSSVQRGKEREKKERNEL